MNPLRQLRDFGQSYWLDNLTRPMITDGELERRVKREGLRGVTSNPAIFHKAISGSGAYDDVIRDMAKAGAGAEAIYEALVTEDIANACDILLPVYDDSDGRDGFVSLEVSPHLARDTQKSIDEAIRLHGTVNRDNLMIKIPGTPEGVPVVEELIYRGIHVNVTLLFSLQAYEAAAEAYLRGLERRLQEGKRIDNIASVASFFLSRIDSAVDELLSKQIDTESPGQGADPRPVDLMGRTAVANAKIAYQSFKKTIASDRWQSLAEKDAYPQRMLWASTSTKDPHYSDVMYVEPLIGPYTVNTLPNNTIDAFADHGKVADTVEEGIDDAVELMGDLQCLGIDFKQVTDDLLEDGINKFVKPYDELLSMIAEKGKALAS